MIILIECAWQIAWASSSYVALNAQLFATAITADVVSSSGEQRKAT